jgi:hypothetical protein
LKFLFDNNLPPSLARGIAHLSSFDPAIEQVIHLRDRFRHNESDEVWLRELANEGGWIVVSIDQFKKSKAERELLRQRGLTVFVLDPQWAKQGYWDQAARFVLWWPRIIAAAKLMSRAAMRVPWRYSGQSTFEQIRA